MTQTKRNTNNSLKWLFKKTENKSKVPSIYKEKDLYKGYSEGNKEKEHVALYETTVEDIY